MIYEMYDDVRFVLGLTFDLDHRRPVGRPGSIFRLADIDAPVFWGRLENVKHVSVDLRKGKKEFRLRR